MASFPEEMPRSADRDDPLRDRLAAALPPRYRAGERLGSGGMAVVFDAFDTRLQREVAIKVIKPNRLYEEGAVARFYSEAQSAARLKHPFIVSVHDVGESGDIIWFAMEKLPGGSLRELLRDRGPLGATQTARVLSQVSDALQHAHSHGILHRDVKPGNILLDHVGNAYLADFGIAKIAGESTLTATGTAAGTARYMSPEQLSSEGRATEASDQFAVGVTAFELLTNSPPYPGDTLEALSLSMVSGKLRNLQAMAPDCPRDLATLVSRMLSRKPEDRWPGMRFVQEAAEEIAVTGTSATVRAMGGPVSTRRRAVWMTMVGLTVIATLLVWSVSHRPPLDSGNRDSVEVNELPVQSSEITASATQEQFQDGSGSGGPDQSQEPVPPPRNEAGVRRETVSPNPPPPAAPAVTTHDSAPAVRELPLPQVRVGSRGEVFMQVNGARTTRLGSLQWYTIPDTGSVVFTFISQQCPEQVVRTISLRRGSAEPIGWVDPCAK